MIEILLSIKRFYFNNDFYFNDKSHKIECDCQCKVNKRYLFNDFSINQ